MTTSMTFHPSDSVRALLDQIYEIKFSKHVPLTVVLISAIYAVFRSTHYIMKAFHLDWFVAVPTALSIELLVLGASANVFIQLRKAFAAQLTKQDEDIAKYGVWLSMALLCVAFAALIGIAAADAWLVTADYIPSILMTLTQIAQSGFIVSFVITTLLDERKKLRTEHSLYLKDEARQRHSEENAELQRRADDERVKAQLIGDAERADAKRREEEQREEAQRRASECPHCHRTLTSNNRKRHIASCPSR